MQFKIEVKFLVTVVYQLVCFDNFSLFVWTNETLNIWSHLLGFVLFFWLMLWDNAIWIPSQGGTFWDHIVLSLGMLCFQVPFKLIFC